MRAALVGSDTLDFNGRLLTNLPDGDVCIVTYPNDLVTTKVGKNGNVIFALNETGRQAQVELRLLLGSPDDKYFNSLLLKQQRDFVSTVAITATLTKRVGDGSGNVGFATYFLSYGIISKQVEVKSNVEGDTEQGVAKYMMTFANAPRTLS